MAPTSDKVWSVYLLRCGRDGSLYCGISPDVPTRLAAHRAGKGARYTRGRGPLRLIYQEAVGSKADASRREMEIKRLSRSEKQALVNGRRTARSANQPVLANPGKPNTTTIR